LTLLDKVLITTIAQDSGKHIESFISKQLEEETPYIPEELKEDVLKWVSAALYAGGADTVRKTLVSLDLKGELGSRTHIDKIRLYRHSQHSSM
jgi:hypothetical protein